MSNSDSTTVDFIARGDVPGQWLMVLVEEGPWAGGAEDELRRVQERLYGCLDAAIDGRLAEKYPQSAGAKVIIRLCCYNVPGDGVQEFFTRFSEGVLEIPDYKAALDRSPHVRAIGFSLELDTDAGSVHI